MGYTHRMSYWLQLAELYLLDGDADGVIQACSFMLRTFSSRMLLVLALRVRLLMLCGFLLLFLRAKDKRGDMAIGKEGTRAKERGGEQHGGKAVIHIHHALEQLEYLTAAHRKWALDGKENEQGKEGNKRQRDRKRRANEHTAPRQDRERNEEQREKEPDRLCKYLGFIERRCRDILDSSSSLSLSPLPCVSDWRQAACFFLSGHYHNSALAVFSLERVVCLCDPSFFRGKPWIWKAREIDEANKDTEKGKDGEKERDTEKEKEKEKEKDEENNKDRGGKEIFPPPSCFLMTLLYLARHSFLIHDFERFDTLIERLKVREGSQEGFPPETLEDCSHILLNDHDCTDLKACANESESESESEKESEGEMNKIQGKIEAESEREREGRVKNNESKMTDESAESERMIRMGYLSRLMKEIECYHISSSQSTITRASNQRKKKRKMISSLRLLRCCRVWNLMVDFESFLLHSSFWKSEVSKITHTCIT